MEMIFVKPARGVVLMPERNHRAMPADGARVPLNAYYMNLIRFGDVERVADAARAVTPAAAASATQTPTPDAKSAS